MTPTEPTPSPAPRTVWPLLLLVVLLVAGVWGSRQWIGAQRSVPAAGASDWKLSVLPPSGLAIHEPTRFEAEIAGSDGRPMEGLAVEFDLTMPEMEMPLNRFSALPVPGAPGRYRGEGTFTMKGKWQIEAIARATGSVARAQRIVQVQ